MTRGLRFAAAALAAVAVAGGARAAGDWRLIVAFLLELPLVTLGLITAWRLTRRHSPPGAERSPVGRVALIVSLLLVAGQVAKKKATYPFLAYTMYGNAPSQPIGYYAYEATLRSGERQRFRPSKLLPALGSARIVRGLSRRLDAAGCANAPLDPSAPGYELIVETLRSLAALHAERHPNAPVERIDVIRVTRPEGPSGPEQRAERSRIHVTPKS